MVILIEKSAIPIFLLHPFCIKSNNLLRICIGPEIENHILIVLGTHLDYSSSSYVLTTWDEDVLVWERFRWRIVIILRCEIWDQLNVGLIVNPFSYIGVPPARPHSIIFQWEWVEMLIHPICIFDYLPYQLLNLMSILSWIYWVYRTKNQG